MKLKFENSKFATYLTLHPETVEETAALADTALNMRQEPVLCDLYLDGTPHLTISVRKVDEQKQNWSISNKNRK